MRHQFRSSRANRDRREQTFARSVIAEAARRHNESLALETAAKSREREVCPDCLGRGEIVREVADGIVHEAVCLECNGKGWIE